MAAPAWIGSKTGMNRWQQPLWVARPHLAQRYPSIRTRVGTPSLPDSAVQNIMAFAGRTRFGNRRRMMKRRGKKRRRGIIRKKVPRSLTTQEKVIRAKLVDGYTSAGGASGALDVRFLNVMDICDPTSGHTNQQILGYNEWAAFYRKACVIGLSVRVRMHNKSSVGVMFGITPMPENQSNNTLTSYEHYMELPGTVSRLLSPDVDHAVLTYRLAPRKFLHLKSLRDEDAFHCVLATETGPSRTFWLNVWLQPIDGSTQSAHECVIEYDFLIRLFDPIVPARSTDT